MVILLYSLEHTKAVPPDQYIATQYRIYRKLLYNNFPTTYQYPTHSYYILLLSLFVPPLYVGWLFIMTTFSKLTYVRENYNQLIVFRYTTQFTRLNSIAGDRVGASKNYNNLNKEFRAAQPQSSPGES